MAVALAPLLTSQNLAVRIGVTTLFENLGLTLHPGDRLGIVGPNGAGKSTLLRILAGTGKSDTGHVAWRTGLRKTFVSQFIPFAPEATVHEILSSELKLIFGTQAAEKAQLAFENHLTKLETDPDLGSDEKWLRDLDKLQHALDAAQSKTVDIPNALAGAIRVAGLEELADQRVEHLSGGQQKRLQLIHALIGQPQLLLLDEPTNHLDVETVEWLEDILLDLSETGFQMLGIPLLDEEPEAVALAIVSHDRSLLDTMANRILEISDGDIQFYTGNYEAHAAEKMRRMEESRTRNQRIANLMRRELAWLSRGPAARTTKQQARINRAEVLQTKLSVAERRAAEKPTVALAFDASMESRERDATDLWVTVKENLGSQLLFDAENISLKHPAGGSKPPLMRQLNFKVKPGMRLAIVGPNGCGKTHILKLLAGTLEPEEGTVKRHELIRISYFDQHRHELDFNRTVRESICPEGDYVHTSQGYVHIMSYLEKFLFSRHDAERTLKNLSGGEQARVLLARMMLEQGNALLLDEPTNDLDIPTLQGLEETLTQFMGGVVFTSHDRYFIQRVATHILVYSGIRRDRSGESQHWTLVPNLEQALELLASLQPARKPESKETNAAAAKNLKKEGEASQNARKAKISFAEKKEFEQIEARLPMLEEKLSQATAILNAGYAVGLAFSALQERQAAVAKLETELQDLQARWEELYVKL
jgi:ATP-binding cassette subfamily F protein uup